MRLRCGITRLHIGGKLLETCRTVGGEELYVATKMGCDGQCLGSVRGWGWFGSRIGGGGLQRCRCSIGIRLWQGMQGQRIAHAAFQFLHSDGLGQNSPKVHPLQLFLHGRRQACAEDGHQRVTPQLRVC